MLSIVTCTSIYQYSMLICYRKDHYTHPCIYIAGRPYDGVPVNFTVTGNIALTATLIGLGGLGTIFAVVCLFFNFIFREKP